MSTLVPMRPAREGDRYAMLIGVAAYDSDAYRDLPPVRADLHCLRAVLQHTGIGMYHDCAMVPDPTRAEMLHAVEAYLEARQPNETALLYFSGYGARAHPVSRTVRVPAWRILAGERALAPLLD